LAKHAASPVSGWEAAARFHCRKYWLSIGMAVRRAGHQSERIRRIGVLMNVTANADQSGEPRRISLRVARSRRVTH
jgi:hypothetical protein